MCQSGTLNPTTNNFQDRPVFFLGGLSVSEEEAIA